MAVVVLRSAYGQIEFSAEADLVITDTQGIDCIEEIEIITDGEIKNLCKVIRRPGGINPITNVSNLGIPVPLRDGNNLKLARFFLKHKVRTGRVDVATDITLDNVRLWCELNESEKEHKDPVVSLVIDAKNWPKTMESLEESLKGHIGVKGVPLSFVTRYEEAVAPSLDKHEARFLSAKYEMIARAPILEGGMRTVTFKIDMMQVWGLIYVITRDL